MVNIISVQISFIYTCLLRSSLSLEMQTLTQRVARENTHLQEQTLTQSHIKGTPGPPFPSRPRPTGHRTGEKDWKSRITENTPFVTKVTSGGSRLAQPIG